MWFFALVMMTPIFLSIPFFIIIGISLRQYSTVGPQDFTQQMEATRSAEPKSSLLLDIPTAVAPAEEPAIAAEAEHEQELVLVAHG